MTILIADDHPVVRRGVRDILQEAIHGVTIVEAGSADDVLRELRRHKVALLILDISMPGRSGLDLLGELATRQPQLPIIVLSIHSEEQYAIRCLRAGASAYLSKDSAPQELAAAATKALAGGRHVSARFAEQLLLYLEGPKSLEPHETLSDREHEVFIALAKGVSLTDIALALHLSVKTVSSYRARILVKMRMQTNAELIRYALEHKLE